MEEESSSGSSYHSSSSDGSSGSSVSLVDESIIDSMFLPVCIIVDLFIIYDIFVDLSYYFHCLLLVFLILIIMQNYDYISWLFIVIFLLEIE